MSLNTALRTAISHAAAKHKAKHPKHLKKGAASLGADAEYTQGSEASHAESGVVVGHPKTGKGKNKGMDTDEEATEQGNSGYVNKKQKAPKTRGGGMDSRYEQGAKGNKAKYSIRVTASKGGKY